MQQRKRVIMPNGADIRIIRPGIAMGFPIEQAPETDRANSPSKVVRALIWSGLMAQADNPRGWQWNPATLVSVLTLMLVVAGLIAGGAYYIGQKDAEEKQILERLNKVEAQSADAQTKSVYAISKADGGDGHAPNQNKQDKTK